MSKREKWITASVAVLVAATLALWIARRARPHTENGDRIEVAASNPTDDRGKSGLAAVAGDGARSRMAAADAMPAGHARDAAPVVIVDVVRADTLAIVPGAVVRFWPQRVLDRTVGGFEAWLRRSTVEEHASDAVEMRADERGVVELRDAAGGGVLEASSDGLWGVTTLESGVTRVTLHLALDTSLSVRVVDPQGSPLPGTQVALRQPGHGAHTDLLTARTGTDGVAVLRHAQSWWNVALSSASGYEVLVPGLLDPPCARVLDRTTRVSETIELVLRPNGSCAVEIVDEQGRELPAAFRANLCLAGSESVCELTESPAADGMVVEHVELGRRLMGEIVIEGAGEPVIVSEEGPRQPGERVRIRVRASLEGTRLVGRIVDASNTPLAGLTLFARLAAPPDDRHGDEHFVSRTNQAGRFVLDVRDTLANRDDVRLELCASSVEAGTILVAKRPLPARPAVGTYDLGDIALGLAPVVVAGFVVDRSGKPVPAALLTLLLPLSSRTGEPIVPMRAGDDGRFELRSATETDGIAVLATKPGYVDRWEHVSRGVHGVRIVLEPAGSIGGRVLLDASLGRGSVIVDAVRVRATEPDAPEAALRSAFLELDGSFVLSDLADGAYTVRAVYAATASVIGRIDGVKVENGRTLRDPRLDPFDLRASHRLIQLELCDARGDPLRDATCSVRPADEHSSLPVVTQASGGRAAFLFSGRPLDVTVSANGYLPARLERLSDSRRVTLQPAGILRLELARDPGLTSPLRLVARVAPLEGGPESPTLSRMGTFDAAGVLILETTFTGAARVDLQVVASHVRDPRMEPVTSRTIRLESQAREQVFRLDFDAAELSRAVEALRGER